MGCVSCTGKYGNISFILKTQFNAKSKMASKIQNGTRKAIIIHILATNKDSSILFL